MFDCFDRIAVLMTEIALVPIQRLAERPMTMAASVRLPSNGQRVLLTVRKRFPRGDDAAPVYAWRLERLDTAGDIVGEIASSVPAQAYRRPEDAFWGATDALRNHTLGQPEAG
jgi:hypothetical protein